MNKECRWSIHIRKLKDNKFAVIAMDKLAEEEDIIVPLWDLIEGEQIVPIESITPDFEKIITSIDGALYECFLRIQDQDKWQAVDLDKVTYEAIEDYEKREALKGINV
jgi:hypothetical protein